MSRLRGLLAATLFVVAASLALVWAARSRTVVGRDFAPAPAQRIVVAVVDTLRADHVSCYGYRRETTPNIDAIAADGVVLENAYANGNWTKPSIASLFTGRWPSETGAAALERTLANGSKVYTALDSALPTLAGTIAAKGYHTGGFVNNPHISAEFGFARGFEHYVELGDCDRIAARFGEWQRTFGANERFFAYLHLLEPHAPYAPREPFRSRYVPAIDDAMLHTANVEYPTWAAWRDAVNSGEIPVGPSLIGALTDLYDAEIRWSDAAIGNVVADLKSRGLYEETLFVVTADHGENFYEHRVVGHPTTTFYEEQIHVPMIIKFPRSWGVPAARVADTVQMMDLTATLTAAAGAAPLGRGRNMTGYLAAGALPPVTVATESHGGVVARFGALKAFCAVGEDRIKITKLLDLAQSPGEDIDVLADKPSFASDAEKRLWRWHVFARAAEVSSPAARPTAEQLRQLQALGYLDPGSAARED